MRRDRILQSAVAAALALVPPLARGDVNPKYIPGAMSDDTSLSLTGSNGVGGQFASPNASGTWFSPFFQSPINNGTTVVGSWNLAQNWSPANVPNGGGVATFGPSGDLVGDFAFIDINPSLSKLALTAPDNVRIFSPVIGQGGTTMNISTGGGSFELN